MSAEILERALGHIATWATDSATWTGRFEDKPITLSPIYPLKDINRLTLKLGSCALPFTTPTEALKLHMGLCGCCFDLRTTETIWCRFQNCHQHQLTATNEQIHTLLTKVAPVVSSNTTINRLILFKNTTPVSLEQIPSNIHHVELCHTMTPDTLHVPAHISILKIVRCNTVQNLEGLDTNTKLERLSIAWCAKLTTLASIASPKLQSLKIHWCQKLRSIPAVHQETLTVLDIQACQRLTELPSVQSCINLEQLRFCWFSQEIAVPSLEHCPKLRFLTLRSMSRMKQLPTFSTERLECLDVAESTALKNISITGIRLRTLIADGCEELEKVDVTHSPNLQRLSLARVSKLKEIDGLVENHSLQHLQISEAPTLSHLDGLETNFELRTVTLVNCPELTHLPNWRRLIQMTDLTIYGCRKLTTLPKWSLPSLEVLKIGGCDSIRNITSFEQFPNLHTLKWTSLNGIEQRIDIAPLINLRHLSIKGHPSLIEIQGFEALHKLETVDLSRCTKIALVEGLGTAVRLRQIELQGCRSLNTLPPLFQLEQLEELGLSHCKSLKRLDCLYHHPHLKLFNISHCPALERLPLLHPRTRASIQRLYCTHLPQPIDISKVVGGVQAPRLTEIHVENSNLLSLHPLLNCNDLIEITGLEPVSRWKLLLKIAIEREDRDWIIEHWSSCLQHLCTEDTDQMAMACIQALQIYSTPSMVQQLFSKMRSIEHASTGDSLIPAPVWQHLFEWLFTRPMKLFKLFEPIIHRKTITIDLMREENWFPVLIDICTKNRPSVEHAHLLETIYQQALFKHTPMYDHLRSRWFSHL